MRCWGRIRRCICARLRLHAFPALQESTPRTWIPRRFPEPRCHTLPEPIDSWNLPLFEPDFGESDQTRIRSNLNQTKPILRSIFLITESIFPLNTCLAMLRVKPFAVWNGICDGNDSA